MTRTHTASARGRRSKRKGKRGELEAAAYLRGLGFDVRRTQQYSGDAGDSDCIGIPGVFIEVKRDNAVRFGTKALEDAMAKALEQSNAMENRKPDYDVRPVWPVVLFRPDRQPWAMAFIDTRAVMVVTYGDERIKQCLMGLSR